MAYRDYQEAVFGLLRARIAGRKMRRDRQTMRELSVGIRDKQKIINQFYQDYPYCKECGHRQHKEHKCNGNKQS